MRCCAPFSTWHSSPSTSIFIKCMSWSRIISKVIVSTQSSLDMVALLDVTTIWPFPWLVSCVASRWTHVCGLSNTACGYNVIFLSNAFLLIELWNLATSAAWHRENEEWIIKRLSNTMSTALVGNWTRKLKFSLANNLLSLLKSQSRKSCSIFSSSTIIVACQCSNCCRLGNKLCWCLPFYPSKLCWSTTPRVGPLILQSKPSIVFWNSLLEWWPDDRQGLELGLKVWQTWDSKSQTWIPPPDQLVVKVWSAPTSLNNLCGVWILLV